MVIGTGASGGGGGGGLGGDDGGGPWVKSRGVEIQWRG